MIAVGYEQSVYTLIEEYGDDLKVCVVAKDGSQRPFVININTTSGTAGKRVLSVIIYVL